MAYKWDDDMSFGNKKKKTNSCKSRKEFEK